MITIVRAKFKVDAKEDVIMNGGVCTTVKMTPVYPKAENGKTENEHENKVFWQYTPGGELRLSTINKAAADQLELGKEYYLDFTAVK